MVYLFAREACARYTREMGLKPSEYGGSDTQDTLGIQPAPHVPTAAEQLRIMYAEDPADGA